MGTKLDPHTRKITLLEMDINQQQVVWFNWSAFTWYVDFNAVYELIDPAFLVGITSQAIILVSSAKANSVPLTSVATSALCVSTDTSFYYDVGNKRLFIHLPGGAEPSLQQVKIGVTMGVSNVPGVYNGVYYEPRLRDSPTVSKSKDPLFFGRISLDNNAVSVENTDSAFDLIGENQSSIFGGEARILQGFDNDAYGSFTKLATRMIENVRVNRDSAEFDLVDKRKGLTISVPKNVFKVSVYQYLDSGDEGRPIPLVYGICNKAPAVCTNRTEPGPPANYHFKIADCVGAGHSIRSIDTVYVKGISKAFLNVDLTQGTFDIANANYTSGDEVTADVHGFTGTPSQNMDNLDYNGDCELASRPALLQAPPAALVSCTWAQSGVQKHSGNNSFKFTKTIAAGTYAIAPLGAYMNNTGQLNGLIPGHTYSFSVWFYVPSGGVPLASCYAQVGYYNGAWNWLLLYANQFDAWHNVSGTLTIPIGATGASNDIVMGPNGGVGDFMYIDDIVLKDTTTYMIQNPADVILDLLNVWLGITYIGSLFNLTEWAATTALLTTTFLSGIGLFISTPTEIYSIIQNICASCLLNFIPQDNGLFTIRMYDPARAVSQDFAVSDLMDVPSYEYDTSQIISYTSVEYGRAWVNNYPRALMDTSQDAAIFALYNKHVLGTFSTFLVTAADAQAFSTLMLSLQGSAIRQFSASFKMQPFDREVMDFITLYIARPGKNMIGRVKAEILSKTVTASKEVMLGCRIVANI